MMFFNDNIVVGNWTMSYGYRGWGYVGITAPWFNSTSLFRWTTLSNQLSSQQVFTRHF